MTHSNKGNMDRIIGFLIVYLITWTTCISEEQIKRTNWNKAVGLWGKRSPPITDLVPLNALNYEANDIERNGIGYHYKRSNWQKANGLWGKRSNWQKANGLWGKRSGWEQANGLWGKRSVSDFMEEY